MSNRAPKYRKHKPSGQAVVTLSGRDYYLGKYNSAASRNEYARLLGEYLANGFRMPVNQEPLMVELLSSYLQWAKRYYVSKPGQKKSSEIYLIKKMIKRIRPSYGKLPISEFNGLSAKALINEMLEEGRSRYYINNQLFRMKHMLRWGVGENLVHPDVLAKVNAVSGLRKGKTKATEGKPIKPVDDSVINATLPHLPQVVADMVRLQRCTGARPGEIVQLRPMDLNTKGDVWKYVPDQHKLEEHDIVRVVLIGPKGQEILKPYLEERDEQLWCFSPKDSARMLREFRRGLRATPANYGNRPGTNKVKNPKRFPGLKYTTDSYRRAIQRGCDKAGIERWSPNQIRHTAATKIREQFGLEAAQYVLGHIKADTTQVYAERNLKLAAEAIKEQG